MRVPLVAVLGAAGWQPILGDDILELSEPEDLLVIRTGLQGEAELGPKAITVKLSGYVKLVTSVGRSARGRTTSRVSGARPRYHSDEPSTR